jgi:hypothetical protein
MAIIDAHGLPAARKALSTNALSVRAACMLASHMRLLKPHSSSQL